MEKLSGLIFVSIIVLWLSGYFAGYSDGKKRGK